MFTPLTLALFSTIDLLQLNGYSLREPQGAFQTQISRWHFLLRGGNRGVLGALPGGSVGGLDRNFPGRSVFSVGPERCRIGNDVLSEAVANCRRQRLLASFGSTILNPWKTTPVSP